MKYRKEEIQQSTDRLKEILTPGAVVWTDVEKVARSGMSRWIKAYVIEDNQPRWIGYHVSRVLGLRLDDRSGAVFVSGCGMDMGFWLVYSLSSRLYPDGFRCLGEGVDHASFCPSSDHSNGVPYVKQYGPDDCPGRPCASTCDHRGAPDVIHGDGGYCLRHRWI